MTTLHKDFFKLKNHFLKIKRTYSKHINAFVQLNAEKGLPTYTLSSFINIGSSSLAIVKDIKKKIETYGIEDPLGEKKSRLHEDRLHYL